MTKQEYADYEKSVAEFIAGQEISFLSTGTDNGSEEDNGNVDPWFSRLPCECCQSPLAGMREYLFARDLHGDHIQFEICEDCVYYLDYGRLDDSTMQEIADSAK
jgi:hypothetical protein